MLQALKRATTDTDWARAKLYVSRIRRLGYPTHPDEKATRVLHVDPSVLEVISVSRILSFPNLQKLRWEKGSLSLVGLFLGPSLVELNITLPTDPHYLVPTLLDSLRTISPSLRDLRITAARGPQPNLFSIFPRLARGLNHLERLSCSMFALPDEALRILGESSTLRIIHINNTAEDLLRALSPNEPMFAQLKHITIRTLSMQKCCDLFSRIDMRHMESLVVGHTNQHIPLASEILEFFETLKEKCSHTLLTSIHVRQDPNTSAISDNDIWQSDKYLITPAVIKPLLPFRNLKGLDLIFECPYDFDDTSMESMAVAWPLMRQFHLGSDIGWGEVSKVTLDGLIPMAKFWPRLESLSICIDPITSQPSGRRPGGGYCCPRLTMIGISTSVIDVHPAMVAAFLTDLFPKLRNIIVADFSEEWSEVENLLPTFADVREQERAWKAMV